MNFDDRPPMGFRSDGRPKLAGRGFYELTKEDCDILRTNGIDPEVDIEED